MTPGIMWIVPGMIKVETGWDIIISTEMILFLIRAAVMRKVQDGCFIYQFVRWIQDQPILPPEPYQPLQNRQKNQLFPVRR